MRLVRHGPAGHEQPGILDGEGRIRSLSGVIGDVAGQWLGRAHLRRLAALDPGRLEVAEGARLGPPIGAIGKIIGVGLNYRDHAAEIGQAAPREPTLFLKATSALCGPGDPVIMPQDGKSLDWEVELGVVIGERGAYIEAAQALDHVAGYCLAIDFSEREFQFNRGGQGFKGKSADSFAPLGPWLLTADAGPDPQSIGLRLDVNGTGRQSGNTADMIFSVAELIAYTSRFMSLQPGDVILTGTPAGVGMGRTPKAYLQIGDRVRAASPILGEQAHQVVAVA